jgi:hypothetical protein
MSFDIFFVRLRFEAETVERKNPFTGEVMKARPEQPLTPEELEAVQEVLAEFGAREPDRHGWYVPDFGDGGVAEVVGSDLSTGCQVAIRRLTPETVRFLFGMLRAADWAMFPAMEGNPAIVSSPGGAGAAAGSFPEVVCGSAEELGALLSGGYGAWERYRDRVVRGDQG